MLPVIEHSVKNKENYEVFMALLRIWTCIPHPWIFLLSLMCKKIRIRRPLWIMFIALDRFVEIQPQKIR